MIEASSALTWCPLTVGDAQAAADLLNAMEAVDQIGESYTAADTLQELVDPYLELERASLGAFAGEVMAGFMKVTWKPTASKVHRVVMDGGVHPDHRRQGVGTALVQAGIEAARALHVAHHLGLELVVEAQKAEQVAGTRELFASQGFTPIRYYQHMEHPLGAAIPDVVIPDGLAIEAWSPESDEDFRMIRNEAYLDHAGLRPMPVDNWKNRMIDHTFRPRASFLAREVDSGKAVGMLVTKHWEADVAATGVSEAHFILIATMPRYRRRGVASALIAHTLGAVAEQGYDRGSLRADSPTPSGSFALYERAGFTPGQMHIRWALEG